MTLNHNHDHEQVIQSFDEPDQHLLRQLLEIGQVHALDIKRKGVQEEIEAVLSESLDNSNSSNASAGSSSSSPTNSPDQIASEIADGSESEGEMLHG